MSWFNSNSIVDVVDKQTQDDRKCTKNTETIAKLRKQLQDIDKQIEDLVGQQIMDGCILETRQRSTRFGKPKPRKVK